MDPNQTRLTAAQKRRGFVSPEDATPDTPSWRIVRTDKSTRFPCGDRPRTVCYGRCTAFESVSEFRAFAEFVAQHPDFALENAYHQATVDTQSITELPDGSVRYRTFPMGVQPSKTVTSRLEKVHVSLWVSQLPWEPIPMEHRDWIKNKPAYLAATTTPEETNEMPEIEPGPATDATARNTILYGPPGTGKTYQTILQAVGIIEGVHPETLSMETAKPRWDELRQQGRIEFVTFHQSYGYEDFVEGIRPVMGDEAGETPRYEVFEGVLKRIALRALGAMLERKQGDESPLFDLDAAWTAFEALWEEDPDLLLPIGSGNRQLTYRVTSMDSGAIRGKNKNKPETPWEQAASRTRLTGLWDKFAQTHVKITGADVESLSNGKGAHFTFIASVYNRLHEAARQPIVPITRPIASLDHAADHYLRRGHQSGYRLRPQNECERYVLVIDEINRGNISKIFGELITLIEDDKRIGADLALTVTLPHSRETFGLPANLYLLGTMNTADKSIALVDVALRRRFEFEELMPDVSARTCPGLTPAMREVITRLNRRIVLRKDRDHQIGHAFFRSVSTADDFNRVFARRVIPLLQEYFYGDWESLRYVLGEAQSAARLIVPLDEENETGARNRWQWCRDAGTSLDVLASLMRNYRIGDYGTATDREVNA